MSLGTAFRAFWAALSNQETSEALRRVLDSEEPAPPAFPAEAVPQAPPRAAAERPPQPSRPKRSEALTLLSMLQRESRLVDLIQEPLDQYSDAQVGAAARPCLKQCAQTLDRVFALKPLVDDEEGATVAIPAGAAPTRFQWIGEPGGSSPTRGRLVHPGWEASKCELAQWTGSAEDANIVAPAQIQA